MHLVLLHLFASSFDAENNNHSKDTKIKTGLFHLNGLKADIQLIGALVNIAAALKISAKMHDVESRDLNLLLDEFEEILKRCMNRSSMDDPDNVTKVLIGLVDIKKYNFPSIIIKAYSFLRGPLRTCIDYDLTKILATPQVITHVKSVFFYSLKSKYSTPIREIEDLFQLRSGCSTYR